MQIFVVKNSLFRVINELERKMYPMGLKEELKYIDDLNSALNCKYSKVQIANMLRRIMSYVILTNSPMSAMDSPGERTAKSISKEELEIIITYIVSHNQYIKTHNSL